MTVTEKQEILSVLNSLEVIEENGGEDAYALVENSQENRKLLLDVGVSSDTINKYGDEETFCILALAFSEGYADLYYGRKLVSFEKKFEVELSNGDSIIFYKHEGDFYLANFEDGGSVSLAELSQKQVNEIKTVLE